MKNRIFKKIGSSFVICFIILVIPFFLIPVHGHCAQAQKEMTIIAAAYTPVGYPFMYPGEKKFVDIVNKQGKGIVQLDTYWGGSLLKAKALVPGLQAGTADLIFHVSAYLLGSYPVLGIQILPVWDSIEESYLTLKIGSPLAELQNEVLKKKNLFQLATSGVIPEYLWTRDRKVTKPEDMKGLKIRVAGKVEAKVIQALGASPVTMPSAELSQALQRGVVDGALMNPWTASGRGIEEYCKYILMYPFSNQSAPIYTLRDKWESWPEDVKKVLLDAAVKWESQFIGGKGSTINEYQLKSEIIPFYEKKGMKAVYITDQEKAAFAKKIQPIVQWWVKQVGKEVGEKALKAAGYQN